MVEGDPAIVVVVVVIQNYVHWSISWPNKCVKKVILDLLRAFYSFQIWIKVHGLNEFKITKNNAWAKENILYAAHYTIISIFIQIKNVFFK